MAELIEMLFGGTLY